MLKKTKLLFLWTILSIIVSINIVSADIPDINLTNTSLSISLVQKDYKSFKIEIVNTNSTNNITLNVSDYPSMIDNEGDTIDSLYTNQIIALANSTTELDITLDVDTNMDPGVYSTTYTLTDNLTGNNETFDLTVDIDRGICDYGEQGNSLTMNIKDPDPNEDYNPGDIINIEVEVDNVGTQDINVQLEAFLYNNNKLIESSASSTDYIENGEDEIFSFDLKIPSDNKDIDEDEDYELYIKAFDDDAESQECIQDSVPLDIKLENHNVEIKDSSYITPTAGFCGDTISVVVDVINLGEKDEDINIKVENSLLNIQEYSDTFEIEDFNSGEDNEASRSFLIEVPKGIEEGIYDFIVSVNYNNGLESKNLQFEVLSCESQEDSSEQTNITATSMILNKEGILKLKAGSTNILHITLINDGSTESLYFVGLKEASDFADESSLTVDVPALSSRNIFLPLNILKNTEEGKYTAILELSDAKGIISSEALTIEISSDFVEKSNFNVEDIIPEFTIKNILIGIITLIILIIGAILLLKTI